MNAVELLRLKMPTKALRVAAWGADLHIRMMDGAEHALVVDDWFRGDPPKPPADWRARLCAMCLLREDGEQMFTNGASEELQRLPGAGLEQLAREVCRFSGIMRADDVAGKP